MRGVFCEEELELGESSANGATDRHDGVDFLFFFLQFFLIFSPSQSLHIMSRAAKLTLAASSTIAMSTVVFVHYQQQSEKAVSSTLGLHHDFSSSSILSGYCRS